MPKISVIIPFYKTPHLLLRKAIDKLLCQSFEDFELLVIDDGNPKEDYAYLKKEYLEDNRVRFIYQENSGVSEARNTGIKLAKGQYIVFHDADDFVENNYLYSLYSEVSRADLVICGIDAQWFPCVDGYVDIRQFLSTPSNYNYVQYTNFSVNKIFKREIIIDNNILFKDNIKLGEDALFISEYLKYCKLIRMIPQRLYHYIPHSTSATNKYDQKYWQYEKEVIDTQMKLFSTYPLNESEKNFMEHWLYIKLRGTLFYYLWWERDSTLRDNIIRDILESNYFKPLFSNKNNPYYSKLDRVVIYLWEKLGIIGIKLSYYMKILKNSFRK
ncbi:glycosyltransferase [Actinobacillus genomosp. 1]|uniref:glycosyltransferase family 2 protein n=1 Tax=Actinobacillus genomosp. 1 TaxID=254839 RepID=UPI002441016B|nr:glycosyltransferase family 2 protein [Actinobacillus genomosp. 1]WGE35425.1 glycosyltransferase [Actinobacillus genomosp. 1]